MGWHGVERETGGGIALSTFCTWDQVKALPTKQVNKKIHIPDVLLLPPLFYGAWSTPGRGRTGVGLTLPVFMERGSRLPWPPPPGKDLFIMDLPVCSSKHFLTPTSLILSSVQGK